MNIFKYLAQNNFNNGRKDGLKTARSKSNMRRYGKNNGFLSGKGFYIALGLCMIAIGISAFVTLGNNDENANISNSSDTNKNIVSNISSQLSANITQEDVPDSLVQEITSSDENVSSKESEISKASAPVAKYFKYPVVGKITKKFSDTQLQYSLTYNDMRLHTGVDIRADEGASIKAAGDGTVLSVENDPQFGYVVKIDHGNGVTANYCGLTKSVVVKKGDTVKVGDILGSLGTITVESVDAPHLHLEFFKNGKPTDPLSLITQ